MVSLVEAGRRGEKEEDGELIGLFSSRLQRDELRQFAWYVLLLLLCS